MQPRAKHQQHHADFGKLTGNLAIGHKTRGERADDHARQQVADQGGQAKPRGRKTKNQGQPQAGGDGGKTADLSALQPTKKPAEAGFRDARQHLAQVSAHV